MPEVGHDGVLMDPADGVLSYPSFMMPKLCAPLWDTDGRPRINESLRASGVVSSRLVWLICPLSPLLRGGLPLWKDGYITPPSRPDNQLKEGLPYP